MGKQWTTADIPDLTGKYIIVTGGNRGLGYASVIEFAKKGAHVVLTSRSKEKGEAAIAEIKKSVPNASVETMELDCSSFKSVRTFVEQYKAKYNNKLDVLLNNAGIGETKDYKRIETEDGHEITWQTNVWSACLLSQLLLPTLAEGATEESPARIVFISSVQSTLPKVKINIKDPENENFSKKEGRYWAYPNTKCADWMISNALVKRLEESPRKGRVLTVCAHPGFSSTEMTSGFGKMANMMFGMPPSKGCLPQVRVSTDPTIPSGAFYGPNTNTKLSLQHALAFFGKAGNNAEPELYGHPTASALFSPLAEDEELCEQLLKKSEEIIGATFDIV
mmetsp:Transcript_5141/g.7444  ORF Transcript_5141/g.7444 Transcript_5141/m.7444 type:complete len:335 (+) Transcript_5141:14-1018(+)